ncbi:MAG: hypothetical protein M9953_02510 [Thermomicrobiales bacterium]|nr:hypothetical protein [Thermomicrobiales bacterium]MCO5224186.1 hypothetical protein [Thermomicrobiales bacterium]
MRLNRRHLITAGVATGATIAGGAAWYLLSGDEDPKGTSKRIDLLAGMYAGDPHLTDPEMLAMLSISGGMPKNTHLELRLFDMEGHPLGTDASLQVKLENLITGDLDSDITTSANDGSWSLAYENVADNGWWQLTLKVNDLTAVWTFLVPDPNLTGFGTPPVVDTNANASAMLAGALNVLKGHTSLRWWEWLSSGNGAIILARFSVTTPDANGLPASFESDSMMAARIPLDGNEPTFRTNHPRTISVGESAVLITNGTPEPSTPAMNLPIDQYDTTYAGYDGVHFGVEREIGGAHCQLVAFHLPGLAEAWFAFWIETETLILRELFMLSVNHYMHWVYYDIDEPFVITLPA